MENIKNICTALAFCSLIAAAVSAQTGGAFDLSHNVVASGGGSNSTGSTGGQTFTADGTAGQGIAGARSTGSSGTGTLFSVRGGFWAFQAVGPTAAAVSVGGRVSTAAGTAVFKARISLTDSSGTTRTAIANQFGYYRFDDVEAGQTYIVSVTAKGLQFVPRAVSVTDELNDLDFVAL